MVAAVSRIRTMVHLIFSYQANVSWPAIILHIFLFLTHHVNIKGFLQVQLCKYTYAFLFKKKERKWKKLSRWSKPNWWITEILNDKRDLLQILQVIKYFDQTRFIRSLLICNVAQQESREEKNMLRLRRNVKIIWKMCGQITGGRTHWGKTETFFPSSLAEQPVSASEGLLFLTGRRCQP